MDENTVMAVRYCVAGAIIVALYLSGAVDLNTLMAFIGGLSIPATHLALSVKEKITPE